MNSIVNYFEKEFELSNIESAKLKYSLDVLFTDISKLLILLILFSIVGRTKEFTYTALALFFIRPFTGGLHFNTYLGCLLFSFSFFSTVILLNNIISLDFIAKYLIVFSGIVILCIAPLIHKNRPGYSKNKKKRFKYFALSIVLIHSLLYIMAMENPYLNISIWVMTLQSIQLLIRKGVDTYEKNKHNKNFT